MKPTSKKENILRRNSYSKIAGLDEAGRGAWAGPLVAAAVILPPKVRLVGLKDSKQLTAKQRNRLFLKIADRAVSWSVGLSSEKIIDQKGLTFANLWAMEQAIAKLDLRPDYLLIDAFKLPRINIEQEAIIRGDQQVYSIAAASIVAKVFRDNLLKRLDRAFPQYNFHKHKGYGTKEHYEMILKHGPCELHRQSFRPFSCL